MARPKWLDDPTSFSPWQTKYLRALKRKGLLTYPLHSKQLPASLQRLVDEGYASAVKKRPVGGRGWCEVRLTAAGRQLFPKFRALT
jgi:hypothetical protein